MLVWLCRSSSVFSLNQNMNSLIRILIFFLLIVMSRPMILASSLVEDEIQQILISSKSDSAKIRLLIELSREYEGQPTEAMLVARSALDVAERNNFYFIIGKINEEIAIAYRRLGDYSKAIEASLKALEIYENSDSLRIVAHLQLQIGSHFSADKNYPKAINYISKALNTFQQRKDTSNMVLAMINLGETYRLNGNADSAAVLFERSLKLNQTLENDYVEIVRGYSEGNLGIVYSSQGKFSEAIQLLKSSINTLGKLQDYYSTSVYQSELAQIYIQQGKKNQGETLLREALEMAEREKLKEQIRDISKDLSVFYEQNNQFQRALDLRKQYEVYHDSLVNIENVRKTEQLESQYWLDRKDANIRILELENESKHRTVIILSVGSFILLVLLFFVYRLQVLRKKAYQKVAEQRDIIEKREKEKALLLKELNHRVKNNLQMVSSMFSLQAGQFRGEPAADALVAARRRIDALMLIHQKLYREDVDTHIKLADYIKELTDNLVYGFGKEVDLKLNLSDDKLYIDSAIPLGIIINELLTNSLKYASDGKALTIYVDLKQENDKLHLVLADNGPGFPEGHDIKKSRSLGLKLVHSLIRQLHGELTQTNEKGCRWDITIERGN
jgi:two-component sensor histidine kinase